MGFMWFATEDGVNRFDGHTFTVFKNQADNPNSLSYNEIKALCQDGKGMLWIGTFEGGLNSLDPRTERVTRFQHSPSDPASLGGRTVRAIVGDPNAGLWVGMQDAGLDLLPRGAEAFRHFRHSGDDPGSLAHDDVRALLVDRRGILWIGTFGGGLDSLDLRSGTFLHHRHEPSDPGSLSEDRITVLCPRLLAALRDWWRVERPAGPWLFPGRTAGKPITVAAMNTHFVRARQRAGLPEWFTFHSLRHAFATHLLESGLDILTIQGLLGHSQLKTTLTYLRVRTAHIQKVRSPLEDLDFTPK